MSTNAHGFLLTLLLAGCRTSPEDIANGPDPLRALAQHVESSRYGAEYWKGVANGNPELWAKATAFCRRQDSPEYPTCASVKMAEFFVGNTQPAPAPDSFSFRTDRKPDTPDASPSP
jgi:hypothetical protein